MKLTIYESPNGCIVVEDDPLYYPFHRSHAEHYWAFNSLDKAIAHVRTTLRRWRTERAAAAEKASQQNSTASTPGPDG